MIVFATVEHRPWYDHMFPFVSYVRRRYHQDVVGTFLENEIRDGPVILYGDIHVFDGFGIQSKIKTSKVLVMHDSPLIDCGSIPYMKEWVFIPSSSFNREILENCTKNVTEVIPKPYYLPPFTPQPKIYDLLINLTQPERKGHESLIKILKTLDRNLDREIKVLASIPAQIRLTMPYLSRVSITYMPPMTRELPDNLSLVSSARVNLFTSYDEGIGLPPIESALMGQQLVMGNVEATNEFVESSFADIVEYRVVKHSVWNHFFLFQIWDEMQYLDLTMKALEDPSFNIPKLKKTEILDFDYIWKKLEGFL